jgi:hypothetical protein
MEGTMTDGHQSLFDRDPDELERLLLRVGQHDRAPEGTKRRALEKVTIIAAGAGVASTAAAHGATAVSGAVQSAPLWVAAKWAAIGVASGALAVGAGETMRHAANVPPASAVAPRMAATAHAAEEKRPTAAPERTPEQSKAAAEIASHPSEPEGTKRRSPNSWPAAQTELPPQVPIVPSAPPEVSAIADQAAPSSKIGPPDSVLLRELAQLEEARVALRDRNPGLAIEALNRYVRDFPSGGMRIEATALRVEALVALGQHEQGRALAQSFLTSYPSSPVAMRVRSLLEALEGSRRP